MIIILYRLRIEFWKHKYFKYLNWRSAYRKAYTSTEKYKRRENADIRIFPDSIQRFIYWSSQNIISIVPHGHWGRLQLHLDNWMMTYFWNVYVILWIFSCTGSTSTRLIELEEPFTEAAALDQLVWPSFSWSLSLRYMQFKYCCTVSFKYIPQTEFNKYSKLWTFSFALTSGSYTQITEAFLQW
jgi:hypothetical protein